MRNGQKMRICSKILKYQKFYVVFFQSTIVNALLPMLHVVFFSKSLYVVKC